MSHVYVLTKVISFYYPSIALPPPTVNISDTSESNQPGTQLHLVCTVTVTKALVATPNISWNSPSGSSGRDEMEGVMASSTVMSRSMVFTSINTSDAGVYQCNAVISIPEISVTVSSSDSHDLIVQCKYKRT